MPNAGLPTRIEGRFVYAADPAYFAAEVPRFLDAGARLIGGCCGTTPEHIAAMRGALDAIGTAMPAETPAAERPARTSVVTGGSVPVPASVTGEGDPLGPAPTERHPTRAAQRSGPQQLPGDTRNRPLGLQRMAGEPCDPR
jgi:homocysteine S-methyltransferase